MQCSNEVHHLGDIFFSEDQRGWVAQWGVDTEFAVEFVAANFGQIVATLGEVQVRQQVLRRVDRNWFTWAQFTVNILERFFLVGDAVFFQGQHHGVVVTEFFADASFGPAQCLQQYGDWLFTTAVQADGHLVTAVDFQLEPSTARRDDPCSVDVFVSGFIRAAFKVGARGTNQLGDDDALGTVNNEGTFVGHQREVTHEDGLLFDFAGVVVHELGFDVQRCSIGSVTFFGFLGAHLRVREFRIGERQGHGALVVFDRRDFFKNFCQTRSCYYRVVADFLCAFNLSGPARITHKTVK